MDSKLSIHARQFRGYGFMTVSKFNNSGSTLYIADKDSKIITALSTIDFATTTNIFHGHNGVIWSIALSQDDSIMYSCSGDTTLCVWNTETADLLHKINQSGIPKIVSINNNNVLAIYNDSLGKSNPPTILFYNNQMELITTKRLTAKISTMNWLNEENTDNNLMGKLITTNEEGSLIIENMNTNSISECIPHTKTIKSVVINKNKTQILTGSMDGFAKLIDVASLETIKTFASNSPICYATFLCNEKKIVLGGGIEAMHIALSKADTNDLRTKIYNVDSTKLVLQIQSHFGPIRFIDTFGKICVTAGQDGSVKIHFIDGSKGNDIRQYNVTPTNGTATTIEMLKTDLPVQIKTEPQKEQKYIVGMKKPDAPIVYEATPYTNNTNEEKKSICVQNLPDDITKRELDETFGAFGKLDDNNAIKIITPSYEETFYGKKGEIIRKTINETFAFINYSFAEGAEKAVTSMNRAKIKNCVITVDFAKGKKY